MDYLQNLNLKYNFKIMSITKQKLLEWWNNFESKYDILTKYYPNSTSVFTESLLIMYNK